MRYYKGFLLALFIAVALSVNSQNLSFPFPNHTKYVQGVIKPSVCSQNELDRNVTSFYDAWKKRYVKNSCADPLQYYVYNDEGNLKGKQPVICVSEGQGYGMLITVLMAGYDKDAQRTYDGMLKFVKAHPTDKSKDLMGWCILKGCKTYVAKTAGEFGNTSATDGDMDIALSLIMADKQWGSSGVVNYREEAIKRIKAILKYEINIEKHTVLLSDANDLGDYDYYDIRSSDFMPTHLKAFDKVYPNPEWKQVTDRMYSIFEKVQLKYSPVANLIPDFIVYRSNEYRPAKPNYLEGPNDGSYYFNACRVPFRLGVDYFINGDKRAYELIYNFDTWIQNNTKSDIYQMNAGYYLTGKPIPGRKFSTPAFVCPFVIGSMITDENQGWIDDCWTYINKFKAKNYGYYDNTLEMLSLIVISGNFWLP